MSLTQDSNERKEIPIFSGFISYFADAMAAVASHSFVNNEKHNPGEPLHWARDKSTDQLDALARHLTELGMLGLTPDLLEKIELLKAIVWRGMAELQLTIEDAQSGDVLQHGAVPDCDPDCDPDFIRAARQQTVRTAGPVELNRIRDASG